jgi:hypothetical protein
MCMCPTVAMGEVCPSLLGHHSSDGTAVAGQLPVVATEGNGLLVHRCFVVMI